MKKRKKAVSYSLSLLFGIVIVLIDWFLQSSFREKNLGIANAGVSFGFASGLGEFWKYSLLMFLVILFVFWFWSKTKLNVYLVSLLIGGLGNMVPRLLYGNVWDYILFKPLGLWFNISDVLILVSVLSYILIADESSYSF